MGILYELTVIMGHKLEDEFGEGSRPDLLNNKNPGREATLESFIIHRLPDLGYREIYADLGIETMTTRSKKLQPRDVRPVVARLRTILPSLPEEGDEYALPRPKAEMQELIDFLEKHAAGCERRGEAMWFSYN